MVLESSGAIKRLVHLVKRRDDSGRYEIVPIEIPLSFENGFLTVIRACQLLSRENDGIIFVGLAGPSGSGKTVLAEKIRNVLSRVAIINMESYTDGSRVIDGDFDDKRLTDYDTLLHNIRDLKDGKSVQVPVYDFKSSSRTGYRTLEVPSSRIVILKGIYALSEELRPFLDLGVSVTGGVPFNLVKRVLGDIPPRAVQYPNETAYRIFDTVYPTYKALIEPDLQKAHINIQNIIDTYSGLQNPTYILKSTKAVTPEQMKAVLSEDFKERTEETRDIYLLPPGEDPEACRSFLRLRNRDGKYYLKFQEWLTDGAFVISPGITFEVNVRLLGGLMVLGYTVAVILKRKSHIFDDDKVTVKSDCFEQQLNRTYVQVQGRDRTLVQNVANQLGLEATSYVPHTYIEQMQLEKLVNKVTDLPDDLKTKISLIPSAGGRMQYPRGALAPRLPNQGVVTEIIDQISTLNVRMDEFESRIEELNSSIPNRIAAAASGSLLPSSSSQLGRESPQIKEEVVLLADRQRELTLQMDTLSNLIHKNVAEMSRIERIVDSDSATQNLGSSTVPVLLALAIGCIGILAYYSLKK